MISSQKRLIACILLCLGCTLLYISHEKKLASTSQENVQNPSAHTAAANQSNDKKLNSSSSQDQGSPNTHSLKNEIIDPYCEKALSSQIENEQDFLNRQMLDYKQKVGSWFFRRSLPPRGHTENTASGNFLLGLAQADLLSGIPNSTPNNSEALQLLETAHLMDPMNSAPLLYLSYLQNKLGLFDEEKRTLFNIKMTDHYNSYLPEVKKIIFSTVRNPSDLFNALSIYSQIPIPDYGKNISNYMIQNKMSDLADQILANEYSRKPQAINTESFLVETAFARRLLTKISPDRKDIPSQEWIKTIMKNHDITQTEKMPPFTQETTGCDMNFYWPAVHELNNSL